MDENNVIKYPVGIQDFGEIREGGYLYVDKTAEIYKLFSGKYYFLSRPRRFGKSLLLSTLEAYYQGRRELFKGLALDSLTDDWEPHPVFHLDLNVGEYRDRASLEGVLSAAIERWERFYGVESRGREISLRFSAVIERAYEQTGKKVVILIDEYDKPLLNAIGKDSLAEEYRSILKSLYSNLKSMDRYIELAFLTGVARFSKVSIFSDLNNLRDLTFESEYSSICGITSEELDSYFGPGISALAKATGYTEQEVRRELKESYDGYHFAQHSPDIYNPFSLVNVFASNEIKSYWFASGTPSYLVRLIEQGEWRLRDIAPVEIAATHLESAGVLSVNPIPVLYQSGYLTIKHYDKTFRMYTLDYPNREVKEGFLEFLVPYYLHSASNEGFFSIREYVLDVRRGDCEGFMKRLDSLLAGVPYSEKGSSEAHFQNAIYLLFTLLGFFTREEQRTSNGRIDLTVETEGYVYIFEFKVDSNAEDALRQIREKEYWRSYESSGKKIFLIGANFDTRTRRLSDYKIERIG